MTISPSLGFGGRASRRGWISYLAAVTILLSPAMVAPLTAQERWKPFGDDDDSYVISPKKKRAAPTGSSPYLPPAGSQDPRNAPRADYQPPRGLPPITSGGIAVERTELAPLQPPPQSGLQPPGPPAGSPPLPGHPAAIGPEPRARSARNTASGTATSPKLDAKMIAAILAADLLPNRSPTLTGLWYGVLKNAAPQQAPEAELASRVEALWRSGFPTEAAGLLKGASTGNAPLLATLNGRVQIGLGNSDIGCQAIAAATGRRAELPKSMTAELLLHAGYCGALNGNRKAAGVIADLVREQGVGNPDTVALLTSIAAGTPPNLSAIRKLTPLGLRLAVLGKASFGPQTAKIATPASLAILSLETSLPASATLPAIERAAQLNLIPLGRLAKAYRRARQGQRPPNPAATSPTMRRAALYVAADTETSTQQKARNVRNFLDQSRRSGLYLQALLMAAPIIEPIRPAQEIGWFSETAIEILATSGQYNAARQWATFAGRQNQNGSAGLSHWIALVDLTDPAKTAGAAHRGTELQAVESLALQGRYAPAALHRLATVLDALDYNVPMRLWEAASRSPQPNNGHLPETGVLKQMQDASRNRDTQHTVLLAIRALGRNGGEGAHMIALGDTIRALRRAGLNREARRIAFESLLALWPRTAH